MEKEKKDAYELHLEAQTRDGKHCEVSRVKYTLHWNNLKSNIVKIDGFYIFVFKLVKKN